MFGWLKKLFTAAPDEPAAPARPAGAAAPAPSAAEPLEVIAVVDNFLQQNPQRTPLGTLALIRAGAPRLSSVAEVHAACEKIAEHGYQYPLSPTVRRELAERHLLDFLRWQESVGVTKEDYVNEHAVRGLIERYRGARKG